MGGSDSNQFKARRRVGTLEQRFDEKNRNCRRYRIEEADEKQEENHHDSCCRSNHLDRHHHRYHIGTGQVVMVTCDRSRLAPKSGGIPD